MERRWRILLLLLGVRTALGFQFQSVASLQPILVDAFDVGYAEAGALLGLYMLPGVVLALPSGAISRWVSDRALVSFGCVLMAAGGIAGGLADSYELAAAGRLLAGAGAVVNTIYLAKMVTDWFAGRELPLAMGVLLTSWPVGLAVGELTQPSLALAIGWPVVFHLSALFCALAAAGVWVWYAPPPAGAGGFARGFSIRRHEALLISLLAGVWLALNAGIVIYLAYVPLRLTETGADLAVAHAVTSSGVWAMALSIPLGGLLAQRVGRPNLVIGGGAVAGMAAMGLIPFVGWPIPLCIVVGVAGIAPAAAIMALSAEALRPEARALGMGIFYTWNYIGMMAAPAAAGWALDRTGGSVAPLLVGAGVIGSGALFLALFRLSQRWPSRA
ncbi:MAG: MFS transporter [Alphaproteobacteria bacterium]